MSEETLTKISVRLFVGIIHVFAVAAVALPLAAAPTIFLTGFSMAGLADWLAERTGRATRSRS